MFEDNGLPPAGVPPPAPPPAAAPAGAAAASAAGGAAAGAGLGGASAADLLGLHDPELDDLKDAAVHELTATTGGRTKRPKLTHGMFFEDDKGLKKILKTFPKVKFNGKGHEFDDLKLLIRNYERWYKEMHPYGDHLEDMVWKTRALLQEKERNEDGIISDPRERLHLLRFEYKNAPKEEAPPGSAKKSSASDSKGVSEDVKRRIEENRQRALELRRAKQAAEQAAAGEQPPGPEVAPATQELDMETLWRIEENRARALEMRQRKLAAAAGSSSSQPAPAKAPAPAAPARNPMDDEEDPFGFGGFGMDDEDAMPAPSRPAATAAAPAATAIDPMDEEDDPFGFGGFGMDDDCVQAKAPSQPAQPAAKAAAPAATVIDPMDEEDDPFGFGGSGLDDNGGGAAAPRAASQLAAPSQPSTSHPSVPPQPAASQSAAPRQEEGPPDEDLFGPPQMEEPPDDDIFGFGCDLDDP